MKINWKRKLVSGLLLFCLLFVSCGSNSSKNIDGWQVATPESQGVSSSQLLSVLEGVDSLDADVDGIVVVKNGFKIMEAYKAPFNSETKHNLFSCTKSVTSILIGIAIDKGYIEGVDIPVLSVFPEYKDLNKSGDWDNVTLEHLLTMSAGLPDYILDPSIENDLYASDDWIKKTLSLKLSTEPGKKFSYSNFSSFLMGAILHKKTGLTPLDFANKHLFTPLGITDVTWNTDTPNDIQTGASNLMLQTSDLAKFGQLFLQKGLWNGEEIVSEAWIKESTKKHINVPYNSFGYGYQWWMSYNGAYMAQGILGQYMIVLPKQNIVVAIHSSLPDTDDIKHAKIISAAFGLAGSSNKAIEVNMKNQKELSKKIKEWAIASSVEDNSKKFSDLSGTYTMQKNPLGFESISLKWNSIGRNYMVNLSAPHLKEAEFSVNSDGQYNYSSLNGVKKATRAYINSKGRLIIEDHIYQFGTKVKYTVTISGNSADVKIKHNHVPYTTPTTDIKFKGYKS